MKYAVIFEETVKCQHQVVLECEDESELDDLLDGTEYLAHNPDFDSILYRLHKNGAEVIDIERDYCVDSDGCEYYDAYEYHDDDEGVEA